MSKVDDNKKQKKQALYQAAFELFTEKGFAKTTISEIAETISSPVLRTSPLCCVLFRKICHGESSRTPLQQQNILPPANFPNITCRLLTGTA